MPQTERSGELVERPHIRVVFQRGFVPEVGINGCRVEDVIALAIDRLEKYQQGPLACAENEGALKALQVANSTLESRVQRRREQGVFNTSTPHSRTEDKFEDFSATGA
ncbi:hypothetical protein EON79_16540 [bacterium]|nr:MAG: hypothetical protein EON79_16540 [bacterium]